ncbi:MAG: polymer-forming cytoskeletal protein [Campylobacterota bacterium]|nr:polymer-forming cytoskeletal protein [Campylobacterota bacterium]
MGIFGKSDKKSKRNNDTTIISNETVVKGGIETQGSVFIDGKFEGVIVSKENVVIGKSGEVLGEIRAKNLTVSGFIDGMFDIETISILSEGKVIGKIHYEEFIIEQNGIFEGEGKKRIQQQSVNIIKLN